jgi:hypothetical protein
MSSQTNELKVSARYSDFKRLDRRGKPRINVPFPVTVQGTDVDGNIFEATTLTDNLSANGLYFRISHEVKRNARLYVSICLSLTECGAEDRLRLELYGSVLRVDWIPSGAYGLAISFSNSAFL